jgi:hypothetical protein
MKKSRFERARLQSRRMRFHFNPALAAEGIYMTPIRLFRPQNSVLLKGMASAMP